MLACTAAAAASCRLPSRLPISALPACCAGVRGRHSACQLQGETACWSASWVLSVMFVMHCALDISGSAEESEAALPSWATLKL